MRSKCIQNIEFEKIELELSNLPIAHTPASGIQITKVLKRNGFFEVLSHVRPVLMAVDQGVRGHIWYQHELC